MLALIVKQKIAIGFRMMLVSLMTGITLRAYLVKERVIGFRDAFSALYPYSVLESYFNA